VKRKWLSPKEVNEVYGINTGTLANWRCQGRGPEYSKIGRKKMVKYNTDVLDRFFKEGTVLTRDRLCD